MIPSQFFKVIVVFAILLSCNVLIISCYSGNQQKNSEKKPMGSNTEVKRVGMVIKIDSSRMAEYLNLHADSNPGVRDLLIKYHLRNFSIFVTQLDDGNYYEFGYYEYTGNNFDSDKAKLDAEPRNKEWLKVCDPMQIPLKGEVTWKNMKQVFYNK